MAKFANISKKLDHPELVQDDIDLVPDLEAVTTAMYEAEMTEKAAKKIRSDNRSKFFDLLTQHVLQTKPLATEFVDLTLEDAGDSVDGVKQFISKHYPEWVILNVQRTENGWDVEIQENPSVAKATFVNEKIGKVFGRTFEFRGAGFDAEGLVKDRPDLAARCCHRIETYKYVAGDWHSDRISPTYSYEFDEALAVEIMSDDPSTVPVFQRYAIVGNLNTKLTPTRNIKEEDK